MKNQVAIIKSFAGEIHLRDELTVLPDLLPKLLGENLKLEFEMHHGLSRHMTEAVISSKVDVAFAVNPIEHPDLIIKEICRDDVTLWRAKG